jgi:hypothetical protein
MLKKTHVIYCCIEKDPDRRLDFGWPRSFKARIVSFTQKPMLDADFGAEREPLLGSTSVEIDIRATSVKVSLTDQRSDLMFPGKRGEILVVNQTNFVNAR